MRELKVGVASPASGPNNGKRCQDYISNRLKIELIGLILFSALTLITFPAKADPIKDLSRTVEAEIASLDVYDIQPGNVTVRTISDVSVDCNEIAIKNSGNGNYSVINSFDIGHVKINSYREEVYKLFQKNNIRFSCDNDLKCIRGEIVGGAVDDTTQSNTYRNTEERYISSSVNLTSKLVADYTALRVACGQITQNTNLPDRPNQIRRSAVTLAAQRATQSNEPGPDTNSNAKESSTDNNSSVSRALSGFLASGGFADNGLNPHQPSNVYGSQTATARSRRLSTAGSQFSAPVTPPTASLSGSSSQITKTPSYRNHPELDAGSCLTFHGPIDLYGERVTNRCGYPVTYIFCIDGAHSALACKTNGDDIGSGTDTVGAGQTQDTGFVDARGGSVQNHWHACKGKSGDVIPLMETRNLGRCMSY